MVCILFRLANALLSDVAAHCQTGILARQLLSKQSKLWQYTPYDLTSLHTGNLPPMLHALPPVLEHG